MSLSFFPVVILAGGLGTRLHPVTHTIPKSLVEVCGEPFIAHQLRYLKKQKIFSVILCLGYLGEMVQEFLSGDEWKDFHISYSFDGDRLLGTAGALKKALDYLPESFFILYGDSYLPCNFSAVQNAYIQSQKCALMTVFKNNGQWDKSNVVFEQGQILDYNKHKKSLSMHYIDYGLGILNKKIFDTLEDDCAYDLETLYQDLLLRNELAGYEIFERFYEVGSFSGIDELNSFLGKQFMNFTSQFLSESKIILEQIDTEQIEKCVQILATGRENAGRLFILGVGGSAANASHAVNDFRKIVGIEAYAPTDNVSELTARTNDEGWETVFSNWLRVSRLNSNDMILVLSVGGGNVEKNVSPNLVLALQYAQQMNAKIMGIVGRDGGFTRQVANACVLIPTPNPLNITPHAEAFQAVIWHLMVSHPKLKQSQTKWESVVEPKGHDQSFSYTLQQ